MARRAGPSVRSRRLATELRALRIAAGLSRADVSQVVGMSVSKIGRVEKAESSIYFDDLEKLLDFYRVSASRRVDVLDLARHVEERGWLRIHRGAKFPEDWKTWADFEAEASAIFNYQPLMIPGLLQTPEYARAIIQATGLDLSEVEVDELVSSRIARQGLLSRTNPVKLHAIIGESVLTHPFSNTEALVRQLRHLLDASAQPHITIQVLPINIVLHPGLNGSFIVLEYDEKPSLVWLENKISSLFLDEDDQIRVYTKTWTMLQKLACDAEESVQLISAIVNTVVRKT